MAAIVVVVAVTNIGNLRLQQELEITTSVALIAVFVLGALSGASDPRR
jgi:uncharacterized membrane protein (DUF4010 family)